ncbi:hypothetical protein D3C81_2166330 [compost metagenome]
MLDHTDRSVQINVHSGLHVLQVQRFNWCVAGSQHRCVVDDGTKRAALLFKLSSQRCNSRFIRHIQPGDG